jgi:hypothetical protein
MTTPVPAAQPLASHAVHDISQRLSADYRNRQPPSPKAASEPPDSCCDEDCAESQEENPNDTAKRSELRVRSWIETPDAIKRRASPEQSNRRKARHGGTEEQENPYRSESGCLGRGGGCAAPHLLNISQRSQTSDFWFSLALFRYFAS